MDPQILAFLTKERVCSLTTLLPNGTPHAAAMHFSHQANPLELYFSTKNTTRKSQGLVSGASVKAAVVVGFSEEEWLTVQMEGEVSVIDDPAALAAVQSLHYAKNAESAKYKDDPATVFLKFTPAWYRFTDFTTKPPTVIGS